MDNYKKVRGLVKRLVYRAFDFASPNRSNEEFENLLISSVARDTGLSKEVVRGFHHPVWWELVLSEDSPIEFYQPANEKIKEKICVRLRDPDYFINMDVMNDYSRRILKKYDSWYKSRANSLLPQA